ncbi:hypothetical protein BZA77DRAFT_360660 [Pyronema omphalodes]|nr:hypothetical protein BZA77DRAFT_360660 [Pyronema omphalodes]
MSMYDMNTEQFDSLPVNPAESDNSLTQFLKNLNNEGEQPQEQLFPPSTNDFENAGLSNHAIGEFDPIDLSILLSNPESHPLQPTEPSLAISEHPTIPPDLSLEDTLYTSLKTYLQNTPETTAVQYYQPFPQPQLQRPFDNPSAATRPESPPMIADNYQAPAGLLKHKPFLNHNSYRVSSQSHQGHQAQQSLYASSQHTQYPINRHNLSPQPSSYQNQAAATFSSPSKPKLDQKTPVKPPNLTAHEWRDLIDIEDQLFMSDFMPQKLKDMLLRDQAMYHFKIKNGYFGTPAVAAVVSEKPSVPDPSEVHSGNTRTGLEGCVPSDWENRLATLQAWKSLSAGQQRDLLRELKETSR